jgi:tetratricopeptide (TPR) repeat protein
MVRKFSFLLLFAILADCAVAQNENIDSLKIKLGTAKTDRLRFELVRSMCHYYHEKGDATNLSVSAKELIRIAERENNDSLRAISYVNVALYFSLADEMHTELELLLKALNLAEKVNLRKSIGDINHNIGNIYSVLGDYHKAFQYFHTAVQVLEPIRHSLTYFSLVGAYSGLSAGFMNLNQADSALYYNQRANEENLIHGNHYAQSFILIRFGDVYDLLKDKDLAEIYYRRAIHYSDSLAVIQPLAYAYARYGNFLMSEHRFKEAKFNLNQGLKISLKERYKLAIVDMAEVLRQMYEMEKNNDSAYFFSKLVLSYRDSLLSDEKRLEIQKLAFSQQTREIEAASQKRMLAKTRRMNIQYAALAIGIISFIVAYLLLSRSIIVSAKFIEYTGILGLLAVFEFVNLLVHPFLERITDHSPVLMLLILMCIAALLIPLHHRLQTWITHQLVQKNRRLRLVAAKKTIASLEQEGS